MEKLQSYADGTDFKKIGDDFTKYLETKFDRRVVLRDVSRDTLNPYQKLAQDVLVRMATRYPVTSKTDDKIQKKMNDCVFCAEKVVLVNRIL